MAKYRSPFLAKATMTVAFKVPGAWSAGYHTGEDWICDNHTLVAPTDGTISYVSGDGAYGNHLIMHTTDKRCILMAHMANLPTVNVGQKVKAGEKVGVMGSTGNSTGLHLHIEVESVADWNYNKNLLKPSDYIDFDNYKTEQGGFQMKLGDNDSTVFAYKILLIELQAKGIIKQGVDGNGIFGTGTVVATKQVQAAAGLKQTGVANAATVKAAARLNAK